MQGLYKLALVGTKEQLSDFLKKVNDTDPDSVFNEYAVEEGTGLRTVKGYGLQKFLDRYKLLIENTGSGNISGMDEMVTEIGKIAPELEIMLLTQYLDYSDDYTWTIFYKPAGETDPSETAGIPCFHLSIQKKILLFFRYILLLFDTLCDLIFQMLLTLCLLIQFVRYFLLFLLFGYFLFLWLLLFGKRFCFSLFFSSY